MTNLNQYVFATGNEARRDIEAKKDGQTQRTDFGYVRLKDGESARGFLLTTNFVMIRQHKDWNRGINTHTCRDAKHGKNCYSCSQGIKTQLRTIVPIWIVDNKEIQILYATRTVMKGVYAFTDEYEEDSTVTPIAITRHGSGKDTRYTLMPARVRTAEKALFAVPSNIEIDDQFMLRVLQVPTNEEMCEMLSKTRIA